nr:Chain F, 7-mer peptide [Human immunodeficiency virus 1]6VQY_G Chain G, 7-mer peptide [Human immunodeficiency virus 1]
KRWIILG